jgi:GT2 family glycosyltransferase
MRIHRSVFETIKKNVAKFPEISPVKEGGRWGFFTPNRVGLGEDVAFCHRARMCGIKVWQDYDLRLLHKAHHFN